MDCMPVDDDYDDDIIVHVCSAEGGPTKGPALSRCEVFSLSASFPCLTVVSNGS